MKRRMFLRALGGSAAVAGMGAPAFGGGKPRLKTGRGGAIKKLVVCFLRGGNDALNTVVPVDTTQYNYYRSLRPTVGLNQASLLSIPGESFFALHPAMSPLNSALAAGDLSFVHAVAYPNSDRSHFESQAFYETGVPGSGLLSGWLNRYLAGTSGPGLIRGVAIGRNIPHAVTGTIPVPVSDNFGNSTLQVDGRLNEANTTAYRQKVRDAMALTPAAGNEDLYETGGRIFEMIDNFSDRNIDTYQPENGAVYPSTWFGRQTAHAAQMLKDDNSFLGVEVVTLNQGGYDTHGNQLDPANPFDNSRGHAFLLNELASAMGAFYRDMGAVRMADTMFLVVSEFGRRAYQNDSNGTDHGIGGLAMIMGGGVNGSVINGGASWPGLHTSELASGNLDWVTDYRDIYAEILAAHFGASAGLIGDILPGHTVSPVGFMA